MAERLFHISDKPGIEKFIPRPSPSKFDAIAGDVVFAISGRFLHNYLLPRNCPRVTYYATTNTTKADRDIFFGDSKADYIMVVESGWYAEITKTKLYCYEFLPDTFCLLDACAGYYVSYEPVKPITEKVLPDLIGELLQRNLELRFTPNPMPLADLVAKSNLNFSLIRMRNAK